MLVYTPSDFIALLMELDSLVRGNYDEESFIEGGVRHGLYITTRAMTRAWRIPHPGILMSGMPPTTSLSLLLEARRALETVFARRREYLAGDSRELKVSTMLCSLLHPQSQKIDRMLLEELNITRKPLLESRVVEHGGYTKEKLESLMRENF